MMCVDFMWIRVTALCVLVLVYGVLGYIFLEVARHETAQGRRVR